MGIYDRGYYQDERERGWSPSSPRSMVTTLIIVNVAVFVLDVFSPATRDAAGNIHHWLSDVLALRSDLFSHPWNFWQLLTAGFTHSPLDERPLHIVFNMYALWLFGRDIENKYGSKEFLSLYLSLIVLSNLIWVIVQNFSGQRGSIIGASGAVAGVVVLFAMNFPHRKFIMFPIPITLPAWGVGVLMVGFDLFGALSAGTMPGEGSKVAFVAHLAGAGLALLYARSGVHLSSYPPFALNFSLPKRRPRLKVHNPDRAYADLDLLRGRNLEEGPRARRR